MSHYLELDTLVIGGGPAGAACATLLAQQGARVAIVEAGDFTQFRIGETVEPSVSALLTRLGVANDDGDWGLPAAGVAAVWGQPRVALRASIVNPYGRGWRVDRRLFDRRLFRHAGAAGAVLFTNARVKDVRRQAEWWEFTIIAGGDATPGRAPFVVEATGRKGRSRFAPNAARLWLDRLIGFALLREVSSAATVPYHKSALVEAGPYGWWYSVLLPGNQALAVFFTDADLLPQKGVPLDLFLNAQLQISEFTLERCPFLKEPLAGQCWKTFDARSSLRRAAAAEGWIAAGDALMAFDPLTGQGITEALRSGVAVAQWLLAGRPAGIPGWIEQAAAQFHDYRQQRFRVYGREDRWRAQPFWRRRQAH